MFLGNLSTYCQLIEPMSLVDVNEDEMANMDDMIRRELSVMTEKRSGYKRVHEKNRRGLDEGGVLGMHAINIDIANFDNVVKDIKDGK